MTGKKIVIFFCDKRKYTDKPECFGRNFGKYSSTICISVDLLRNMYIGINSAYFVFYAYLQSNNINILNTFLFNLKDIDTTGWVN